MRKNHAVLAAAMIVGALLACNLPANSPSQQSPDAILTAAALTVEAQLSASGTPTIPPADTATPAPAANTPTFTAVPSATLPPVPAATATSSCDKALFIMDVSYPDNTVVPAGTAFTKTWRLQNTGSCSWTPSYALVFVSGNSMNGPTAQALSGNVNPGQTVDISADLQAPSDNGTYTGNWGLRNASGVIFSHFYVLIKVNSVVSGGPFKVSHVSFTVSGSCPNFHIVVAITTNGAGTVNYHRVWNDGGTDTSPGTLTFGSASTQSVSYDTYFGGAHSSGWMDIYIDSPNHQELGRANYSCP